MQFLVSVIDDKDEPGSADRRPAIGEFNERLIAEGSWVFAGGLADPWAATVIDNRGEQPMFTDGPTSSPRSTSPAYGCGNSRTSMRPSPSPLRHPASATGGSRSARSSEPHRDATHAFGSGDSLSSMTLASFRTAMGRASTLRRNLEPAARSHRRRWISTT